MVNKWTREETLVAFNVYCKIPFKDSHSTHPMIVEYAKIIGRSPSALNMKMGNLGRRTYGTNFMQIQTSLLMKANAWLPNSLKGISKIQYR